MKDPFHIKHYENDGFVHVCDVKYVEYDGQQKGRLLYTNRQDIMFDDYFSFGS